MADEELEQLSERFKESLGKISVEYTGKVERLNVKVEQSLKRLEATEISNGSLEPLLLIRKMRKGLSMQGAIPEVRIPSSMDRLSRLRKSYLAELHRVDNEKSLRIKSLIDQFAAALEGKERSLTIAGKINEALACREMRERSGIQPLMAEEFSKRNRNSARKPARKP